MDEERQILLDIKGACAWVTLNRPKSLNTLSRKMLVELDHIIQSLEKNRSLSVLILRGSGKAFCAGMDIKDMAESEKGSFSLTKNSDPFSRLLHFPKPKIAAVNGLALTGGLEIVLTCDIIIASKDAVFADTHGKFGFIPGGGMSQLLPRIIGEKKAKEISLTGKFLSAQEALELGLINRVVDHEELDAAAKEIADAILGCDQAAVQKMKWLIDKGMNLGLKEGLLMERREFQKWIKKIDPKDIQEKMLSVMERGREQVELKRRPV